MDSALRMLRWLACACCLQIRVMFHVASTQDPPDLPEHLSDEAKDFLLLCFQRDVNLRPRVHKLLHHPWFEQCVIGTGSTYSSAEEGVLPITNSARSSPATSVESERIPCVLFLLLLPPLICNSELFCGGHECRT